MQPLIRAPGRVWPGLAGEGWAAGGCLCRAAPESGSERGGHGLGVAGASLPLADAQVKHPGAWQMEGARGCSQVTLKQGHLCSALRVPPEPRRRDHRWTGGKCDHGSRHQWGRGGSTRPHSLLPPLGGRTEDSGLAPADGPDPLLGCFRASQALFRGISGTPGSPLPESVQEQNVPILGPGLQNWEVGPAQSGPSETDTSIQ